MRVLHTSDWHLGRSLYGRGRHHECAAFLDWTVATLKSRAIDVLIIAGDIFDTGTPPNWAQELYFDFLWKASKGPCQHVVITAGNHDSPSFLNAPRSILKQLSVHVVGSKSPRAEDEVIILSDKNAGGKPGLICCAVPYLRDRDLRLLEDGEDLDAAGDKYIRGIQDHYREAARRAQEINAQLPHNIPVIATGHLFVAGGSSVSGDGVRELTVGTLSHIPAAAFPGAFDYLALGHLHSPQEFHVTPEPMCPIPDPQTPTHKRLCIRYSGSPLHMSFGELDRNKSMSLITFKAGGIEADGSPVAPYTPTIEEIAVPAFQRLVKMRGNLPELTALLKAEASQNHSVWVEANYTGEEWLPNLRESLEATVAGTPVDLLCIKDCRRRDSSPLASSESPAPGPCHQKLDELGVMDVFEFKLEEEGIEESQRATLRGLLALVLKDLEETDTGSQAI